MTGVEPQATSRSAARMSLMIVVFMVFLSLGIRIYLRKMQAFFIERIAFQGTGRAGECVIRHVVAHAEARVISGVKTHDLLRSDRPD